VNVASIPGGVEIALPPRTIHRGIGVALLVVGVGMVGFAATDWIDWFRTHERNDVMGFIFQWAFSGPPTLFGSVLAIAGTAVVMRWSRSVIRIGHEAVQIREHIAALHWTWAVPHADLRAMVLPPGSTWQVALWLRRAGRPDLLVAPLYPRQQLAAVAEALRRAAAPHRLPGDALPLLTAPAAGPPPGDLAVVESPGRVEIAGVLPPPAIPMRWVLGAVALGLGALWWWACEAEPSRWMIAAVATAFCIMVGTFGLLGRRARRCALHLAAGELRVITTRTHLLTRVRDIKHQDGKASGSYRAVQVDADPPHTFMWPGSAHAKQWMIQRLRRELGFTPPADPEPDATDDDALAVPVTECPEPVDDGTPIEVELRAHPITTGTLAFGLLFAAFPVGFAAFVRLIEEGSMPGMVLAMSSLFVCIGLGLSAWGLMLRTRRTAVAERDGRLMVRERGLFRRVDLDVALTGIASIAARPTGSTMNDWKMHALVIAMADGATHRFGVQARPEQLIALAARLRARLGRAAAAR
jgi:hypothetical protein